MMIATLRRNSKDFFISVIKLFHHITSLFSGIIPAFNTILLHIEKDLVTVVMTITGLLYFSQLSFYFPLLFLLISIIYILVYFWRHIPIELVSYIWFMINSGIFVLFLLGFYNVFFIGLPNPIHLQDLSDFSYWRYFAFLIIALLALFSYLFFTKIYVYNISGLVNFITFPYLYEATKRILISWEDEIFGPLWSSLIKILLGPKKLSFIIVDVLFLSFPLIQTFCLIHVVFFTGDLRVNLYLLPISFISFIYKNLRYYFTKFVSDNSVSINKLLLVKLKNNIRSSGQLIYTVPFSDLEFKFSSYALENYAPYDEFKDNLIALWIEHAQIEVLFLKLRPLKYLSLLNLVLQLFCYYSIVLFFLSDDVSSVLPLIAITTITRFYATEAWRVNKAFEKALEQRSSGAYKGPHPVTTDPTLKNKDGEIPFYHQPTHGSGTKDHPSYPLSDSTTGDLEGNARPQNAVPPKTSFSIPSSWIEKQIPDSDKFYEHSEVKENIKKHFPEIPPDKL